MAEFSNKIGVFKTMPPVRNHRPAISESNDTELEKACHQFESIFVKYMLQTMRKTIPEDKLFGGGQAENIYTEMLDDQVAQSISNRRGIGLAAIMYAQMASTDEKEGK
jgi:flagellar protein FlgJ